MTAGGQIIEQASQVEQVFLAGGIAQRWIFLAQVAEPAEQMGIATQLCQLMQLREIGLEIGEEATGGGAIVGDCAGSQGSSQNLNMGFKKLAESQVRKLQADAFSLGSRREIFRKNQAGLQGMTRGS